MKNQQFDSVVEVLERIVGALERIAANGGSTKAPPVEEAVSPWITPGVPEGYDTVLGYLGKTHPEVLDLMEDPISGTQHDGFWLQHRSARLGRGTIKVEAPAPLLEAGIQVVNAYPVDLLRERLG